MRGIYNHKFFILFLVTFARVLFTHSDYSQKHLVVPVCNHNNCTRDGVAGQILVMLVCVEAVMFALFTVSMFCEQTTFYGNTQIDGKRHKTKSYRHGENMII